MKESVDKRVQRLKQEEMEYEQLLEGKKESLIDQYAQTLEASLPDLKDFFEDEIFDTIVDVVQDDDDEFKEMQSLPASALGLRSSLVPKRSGGPPAEQASRRRSGLRSN